MFSPPTRVHTLELLDAPEQVADDLPDNLRDIRRLNRWFGGTALMRHCLVELGAPDLIASAQGRPLTLLDVATGSGDIPLALADWGARRRIDIRATGLDRSPEVLSEAQRLAGRLGGGRLELVRGDARSLPWPEKSFDVVTCALALHHFEPEEAVQVLREMRRVARRAVIVTDLRRSFVAYGATWLVTRVVARNRLTRHDGPVSVLRAYTVSEVAALGQRAGLDGARVQAHRFFRLALSWIAQA